MSPTKTKESWRDLMTPKELAAYDAGKPLPPESSRVSRSNRLTTYSPKIAEHQPDSQNGDGTYRRTKANISADGNTDNEQRVLLPADPPDPELRKFYQLALEAIDAYASLDSTCVDCGKYLPGDVTLPRTTILIHNAADDDRCRVFCGDCWNAI